MAGKGFMSYNTISIQLIRATGCLHPVFRRVMVAVLLCRKGGRKHGEHQDQGKQQRNAPLAGFIFCHVVPPRFY